MQKNILLIDDEIELSALLSRLLALEGYNVTEAANLTKAKKLLSADEYPVVILDVQLPDGNGVDFIKEIKPRSRNRR